MIELFILAGPTGIGKTDISIKMAKKLNGEIISADSMQIYKHMDVGSAKVNIEEMGGIPHHLIDIIEPVDEFSAADFKELASKKIEEIVSKDKLPMVVGGTGLYINSLICNYSFTEAYKDDHYRDELENIAMEKGKEYVHELLRTVDMISYENIHPNNLKRNIRALEVYKLTWKPFSLFKSEKVDEDAPYSIQYFVLTMARDKLYERINKRVDLMMEHGLVEEVYHLKEMGLTADNQSMKGIGYKEILYYLDGKINLEEAVEMIKQGSRNYAKRQLTWFRKDKRANWIDKDDFKSEEQIIEFILNKRRDF